MKEKNVGIGHLATRKERGITLIALVITIILIVILAGVAISLVVGDKGIATKARMGANNYNKAKELEQAKLDLLGTYTDYYTSGSGTYAEYLAQYYSNKDWVNSAQVIEEDGQTKILIETKEGYEMKVNVNNSRATAEVDESSYTKINYDATIKYNANGGEGTMEDQAARINRTATLKNNTFTKEGYAFVGWSLSENGSVIAENKITPSNSETNVYAIWAESYTVSFNGNGGEGQMDSIQAIKGNTITLPANTFTKEGTEIFIGWKVGSTTYTDKQQVTVNSNMEFVAQWAEGYIVTLDSNNGTGEKTTVGVAKNSSITLPNNTFTNGNKYFYSWNTQADGSGTTIKNSATITPTEDMNLYVQWIDAVGGNDLLSVVKNNTFEDDRVYLAAANNELYGIHVYNVDGDLEITSSVEYGDINDVAHLNSATNTVDLASNMVVLKVNGDLNITSTGKLTAYHDSSYGGPKGMLIYVTGTLTNAGEISMTARGAYAEGQNVYLFKNANGTYEFIPANKNVATARLPGAGGRGGGNGWLFRGQGGLATSYSGGAGSTGMKNTNSQSGYQSPSNIGGRGGLMAIDGGWYGKGAGNPWNGTGGTLIIYCQSFANESNILSKGSRGDGQGGGNSGGGSINVFYNNLITRGTINVDGGPSHTAYGTTVESGPTGSISLGDISTGTYVEYSE